MPHRRTLLLDAGQQKAFADFVALGNGIVAIHAASTCLYGDTDFARVLGASSHQHSTAQNATFITVPASAQFAATSSVPARWTLEEEVYSFLGDPRSNNATVVLSVDGVSYTGVPGDPAIQGSPAPIAWVRDRPVQLRDGRMAPGRAFYTSLGASQITSPS